METETKQSVLARLTRIAGQLDGIRRMIAYHVFKRAHDGEAAARKSGGT